MLKLADRNTPHVRVMQLKQRQRRPFYWFSLHAVLVLQVVPRQRWKFDVLKYEQSLFTFENDFLSEQSRGVETKLGYL